MLLPWPAEMPLDTMFERVLRPRCRILGPVSACWGWVTPATEEDAPTELSPCRITLGYFHVIAEPVSTCVHEILELTPAHLPRLVTKLKMPPRPASSPAYQF